MEKKMEVKLNKSITDYPFNIISSYDLERGYNSFKNPITLNHKGKKITGKITRSVIDAFHTLITKENILYLIEWNENPEEINNNIFFNKVAQ
jgi:hypothetical protein